MNLVVIHTKNNFTNVNKFIQSINASVKDKYTLLIVDDSSTKKFIKKNSEIKSNKTKIIHIHKYNWNLLREQLYTINQINEHKKFLQTLELGSAEWNTGNARSVGYILASMLQAKRIIFFDDDMVFDEEFSFKNIPKKNLVAFKIKGSPDFSRLEWIQLYIKLLNKNTNIYSNYVEKVFQKCGHDNSEQLLNCFTDIFGIICKDKNIQFPAREEISGGLYGITTPLLAKAHFPNCYEEDWIWFNEIKSQGYKETYIDFHIKHDANVKKILDNDALVREEIGKIHDQVIRKYKKITMKNVEKVLKSREEMLTNIIEKLQVVNNKEQTKKIAISLQTVRKKLRNINCQEIAQKLNNYFSKNKEWELLINKVKQIKLRTPRKIVALSPHSDDVFFSAYYLLNQSFLEKEIHTFFSISNYVASEKELGQAKVTSLRKQEDKKAAEILEAKQIYYDYLDAPLRGDEDYLNRKNNKNNQQITKKIRRDIQRINKEDVVILIPLGTSPHIDHIIVHKATCKIKSSICYDESYDNTINIPNERFTVQKIHLQPFFKKKKDLKEKVKLCKEVYPSQINDEQEETIKTINTIFQGERFWKKDKKEVYLL